MTEADRAKQDEWMRDYYGRFPYGEQDAAGIDLSQLRANLKLTPTERMVQHHRALELAMEVRRAGEAARRRRNS